MASTSTCDPLRSTPERRSSRHLPELANNNRNNEKYKHRNDRNSDQPIRSHPKEHR
jgi:hypothetical protein